MNSDQTNEVATMIVAEYKKIYSQTQLDLSLVGQQYPIPKFSCGQLMQLCREAKSVIMNSPNILHLQSNIFIVGDLHGSIRDLLRILSSGANPERSRILFLCDYVDRGAFSIEVISLLFSLMIVYPQNIFLIRGNHEFLYINENYGFREQIVKYYHTDELWIEMNNVFDWLPLAAIIENVIFCVHGGIANGLENISVLEKIQRPISDFSNQIICDIMWSDPSDNITDFCPSPRGIGQIFGIHILKKFLKANSFQKFIRAHQCVINGVEVFLKDRGYTVFSASNYCDVRFNKSGLIKIEEDGHLEAFNFDMLPTAKEKDAIFHNCGEFHSTPVLQLHSMTCIGNGRFNSFCGTHLNRKTLKRTMAPINMPQKYPKRSSFQPF